MQYFLELQKNPNAGLINFLQTQDESTFFVSVLVLAEIKKGIAKLSDEPRKKELSLWLDNDLINRFQGRILPLDLDTALT